MSREKLIIICAVFVDVLGFGIVIPILPFYVTEFGVSPTVVTLLFASFSLFAFASAPLLGALSDRIGRRPILILSIVSTAIGWFVFAGAQAVWMLFLGRIIDGAAAGNFTIAQSYMADIAKGKEERTANIGLVSAVFGMGFLLGPVVGGVLSHFSHSAPFWFAGGLAAVNALFAYFFLPETHHQRETGRAISFNPFRPLKRAAEDSALRPFYLTWVAFSLAFVSGQSVFALFAKDVFGFTAFQTGMAFTLIGVVVLVNQVLLLKRFWLPRFGEIPLIRVMLWILVAGLAGVGSTNGLFFFAGLVALGTGQAVLRVVVTSQVSGLGGEARKGETIGVLSSIMAASMVIAPPVVGVLFEIAPSLPYGLAVLVLLWGVVMSKGLPAIQSAAA